MEEMDRQTIKNVASRHAMALLGEETLFLCHQIMTHMEPHSYEFVLEVLIPAAARAAVVEDREKNGNAHYFGNQPSDELTLPSIVSGAKTSFMADVWTSVPDSDPPKPSPQPPWGIETPIDPWLENVEVQVVRVVHYRHLNRNEVARKFEEYILFGRDKEAHILHSVIWQPEYDHVATLKHAPDWIDRDQLAASVIISVPSLPYQRGSTYCENPLPDDSEHEVLYFGLTEFRDPMGQFQNKLPRLTIHVVRTWWFSTKIINYWQYQSCKGSTQIS